jgi:hypothetical protein
MAPGALAAAPGAVALSRSGHEFRAGVGVQGRKLAADSVQSSGSRCAPSLKD